jgi:hypothetical protein
VVPSHVFFQSLDSIPLPDQVHHTFITKLRDRLIQLVAVDAWARPSSQARLVVQLCDVKGKVLSLAFVVIKNAKSNLEVVFTSVHQSKAASADTATVLLFQLYPDWACTKWSQVDPQHCFRYKLLSQPVASSPPLWLQVSPNSSSGLYQAYSLNSIRARQQDLWSLPMYRCTCVPLRVRTTFVRMPLPPHFCVESL